jgi:hypothetical protein
MDINSRKGLGQIREEFNKILLQSIRKYANIVNSPNSTGDIILSSKNCKMCFEVMDKGEDSAYLFQAYELRDNHDGMGLYRSELTRECIDVNFGSRLLSSITIYNSNDICYSINCHGSHNLFGCIGLRNKSYCIFNKQYSESEYKELVAKIIEQMNAMPYVDKKGRVYKYGEFFPSELSPFAYNETIAQEYFPITKDEAEKNGYLWKEDEVKNYKVTIKPEELPEKIDDVEEEILNEIIGCAHEGKCNEKCTIAFKIIPQELQFYKKMNLPLPLLCPNCRHFQRLKQRNPMRLWQRKCQCSGTSSENGIYQNTAKHFHGDKPCTNEFETTYSPDQPEIVYCEECYKQEVS